MGNWQLHLALSIVQTKNIMVFINTLKSFFQLTCQSYFKFNKKIQE
jgi:hypothetical protein